MTSPAGLGVPGTAALAVIETEAKTEVGPSAQTLELIKAQEIRNADDYAFMANICQQIKGQWNAIDEKRKSFTGPAVNFERTVNAFFAMALKPLKEAELLCRQKLQAYAVADHQHQMDAVKAAQGNVPAPTVPEVKGVSSKIKMRWRITNPDLVARQFCSPDAAKIQAFLDNGGLEAIPGVEFYPEAQMRITGSKT